MVCEVITEEQLCEASTDVEVLKNIVNGGADFDGTGLVTTRLGAKRKSIARLLADITAQGTAAINAIGYEPSIPFANNLVIDRTTMVVEYQSKLYAPRGTEITFTTTSTFDPSQWYEIHNMPITVDHAGLLDGTTPIDGEIAWTKGRTQANDGGAATYRYDINSTATVDGGLILLGPSGVGRWVDIDQSLANVIKFGATPDGGSDSTAAFDAACASGKTVYIPSGPAAYMIENVTLLPEIEIIADREAEIHGLAITSTLFTCDVSTYDGIVSGGKWRNATHLIECTNPAPGAIPTLSGFQFQQMVITEMEGASFPTDAAVGNTWQFVQGSRNKGPLVDWLAGGQSNTNNFIGVKWTFNESNFLDCPGGGRGNNFYYCWFENNKGGRLFDVSSFCQNWNVQGCYFEDSALDYIFHLNATVNGTVTNFVIDGCIFGEHNLLFGTSNNPTVTRNAKAYVRTMGNCGVTWQNNAAVPLLAVTNTEPTTTNGGLNADGSNGQRIFEVFGNNSSKIVYRNSSVTVTTAAVKTGASTGDDWWSAFDIVDRSSRPNISFESSEEKFGYTLDLDAMKSGGSVDMESPGFGSFSLTLGDATTTVTVLFMHPGPHNARTLLVKQDATGNRNLAITTDQGAAQLRYNDAGQGGLNTAAGGYSMLRLEKIGNLVHVTRL